MRRSTIWMPVFAAIISYSSLLQSNHPAQAGESTTINNDTGIPFNVVIDWVPSPEYYGFFYAKETGIYRSSGLNVDIEHGSGAPSVASRLAAGSIYAGTTTSDNVLRQIARGAIFDSVTPLLEFNPVVIASLSTHPIKTVDSLKGKTIGVNQQSSAYQQFLVVLQKKGISPDGYKEYPIGYGGAAQLKVGEVDAILAYTTNVVIDLEASGSHVEEIRLEDKGNDICSFGVVLVIAAEQVLNTQSISRETVEKFISATLEGYRRGAEDVVRAVAALQKAEPTLNKEKLTMAIDKIGMLNRRAVCDRSRLDDWVNVSAAARGTAMSLYRSRLP